MSDDTPTDDTPTLTRGDEYIVLYKGGPNDGRTDRRISTDGSWDREITVILHENRTLPAEAGRQINTRKKNYVVYLGELVGQVQRQRGISAPAVSPQVAGLALLGMINWMYQWYRPEGPVSEAEIARQYTELFFHGAFAKA